MNFLLDMGISPRTGAYLEEQGHSAKHLQELGLERMEDPAILERARSEKRILLTHDLDFSDLMAASSARLPSVVVFRLENMRPENVNWHLDAILAEHERTLEEGAIFSVTEGRMRWRALPMERD